MGDTVFSKIRDTIIAIVAAIMRGRIAD